MRGLVLFAAVMSVFLTVPASAQTADVLAPAREGRLQCFEPNAAQKTCQTLGSYAFSSGGVISNAADILISPSPAIVMRITSPVTVRENAICGPLTAADIERASFTIAGAPASHDEASEIRAAMTEQLAPMFNVESCLTITQDSAGLRTDTSMGGVPQPHLTQRMIWVGANEGYRVAP